MNSLVRAIGSIQNPPQSEALRADQVKNSAGGYVWKVDDLTRFKRFLVLGSEGGTYYIGEQKLTKESIKTLYRLIGQGRGQEVVEVIKEYSLQGRVHRQEPLLFSLAACCRCSDLATKKAAYAVVNEVCRIPTHLFSWVVYCELLSTGTGWGRAHRRAVSNWYLTKDPKNLAYLVTKYQQRNGFSHRDVLRLGHIKPNTSFQKALFKYITSGDLTQGTEEFVEETELDAHRLLKAVEAVKSVATENELLKMIKDHHLAREHIPTKWLNTVEVWRHLLNSMGLTALIRNLGKMTSIGLLGPSNPEIVARVAQRITNVDQLKKARVHPLAVLLAMKTYSQGKGMKGSLNWQPVQKLVDSLDSAFYSAFKAVEPTNQSYLLGLDISGSMSWNMCSGTQLSCRDASAALAMVTAAVEPVCHIMGFANNFMSLNISPRRRLDDNIRTIANLPFGGTDCALPMIYATQKKIPVDNFIIYTDNETWAGRVHPVKALQEYRKKMNKPHAKLIVVAMAGNNFTIADPNDPGMLDVPGFDAALPQVISTFVRGI